MSGHSKWHGIKHRKAVVDQRRGKLFAKLLRAIEVAARSGGGAIESNPTLGDAIQRARDASVPTDTIERAIKRGTGEVEGASYETLVYEGYAPGGVAVLVEVLTDNRNRAAADVRRIFTKHGGSLAEPRSVAWMFTKRGSVLASAAGVSEDELLALALEAGAEDVRRQGDQWEILCEPAQLHGLRSVVEKSGLTIDSARLDMQPNSTVPLDESTALGVLRLIDELEEAEDVQDVYSNFDIPEEVMARVAG